MLDKIVPNLKKGFTLVEILVVVSIIVILVGIAVAAGSSAKSVARDNQRKTDMSLLQLKLEAYREQYGIYPTSLRAASSKSLVHPPAGDSQALISDLVLPKDPSTKVDYTYTPLQFSGGTCGIDYYLAANLENNGSSTPIIKSLLLCDNATAFVVPSGNKIYGVTSPSAITQ